MGLVEEVLPMEIDMKILKKKKSFGLRHKFAVFVFGGLSFTEHVLKYVLNSVEFYMIVCHCCLCTSNSTL